ncbi:hypothetical protein PsAD2_03980 [Pseudovibrio axinellae]|uniref:Uncharacterized protein n=1 Tax=Pseudovibrio axinellae TaxID=989403 RepID=A0A165UJY3_9HYPH|nr:hypothetical protein PsAD2_03980 [Pseudovibrio axinellae]SER92146.1 hypothetical protein SAMN05421798_1623 [Pseudovibrio axinellae]
MTKKNEEIPRFTLAGILFLLLLILIPFGSVFFIELISINPFFLIFDIFNIKEFSYLTGEYLILYYNLALFALIMWYFSVLRKGDYSYFTKSISIILTVIFIASALVTQIVFSGMLYKSENHNVTPIENSR